MATQQITPETFAAALRADGFGDGETRVHPAGRLVPDHMHPYDVRALVLAGEITLTFEGEATAYRPGEVFTMQGGHSHAEAIGPAGVELLVGRRPVPAG